MERYRVVLEHETGRTVLEDNILSGRYADIRAAKLAENYGDGQVVYVEAYDLRYDSGFW